MTKQEIINYVMHSPENTNPAILGQMIEQVSGNDIFYIEAIKDEDTNFWLTDKSYNEILEAAEADKFCIVSSESIEFSEYIVLNLNEINYGESGTFITFAGIKLDNTNMTGMLYIFYIYEDGTSLRSIEVNLGK